MLRRFPSLLTSEDIESSVDASMFRIVLESGDVVDTSGFNLLEIEHAGYIVETIGNRLADKTYIVRFKTPDIATDAVVAARVKVHDEHLAFVNSKGRLAALFLFENVESWSRVTSDWHSRRSKTKKLLWLGSI